MNKEEARTFVLLKYDYRRMTVDSITFVLGIGRSELFAGYARINKELKVYFDNYILDLLITYHMNNE